MFFSLWSPHGALVPGAGPQAVPEPLSDQDAVTHGMRPPPTPTGKPEMTVTQHQEQQQHARAASAPSAAAAAARMAPRTQNHHHHLAQPRARRHPAAPVRVALPLSVDHYAWLVGMGREHYYGYAGPSKALRDVLLWAAEANPDDTHWMFTTAVAELESWATSTKSGTSSAATTAAAMASKHPTGSAVDTPAAHGQGGNTLAKAGLLGSTVHTSCDGALLTSSASSDDGLSDVSSYSGATPSCLADVNYSLSSMSLDSCMGEGIRVTLVGCPQQAGASLDALSGTDSDAVATAAHGGRASCCATMDTRRAGPIVVDARLPVHVFDWLTMSSLDYTNGDLSAALDIVCTVALALGAPEDIFNTGDDGLAYASSADLYAMIGINDQWKV